MSQRKFRIHIRQPGGIKIQTALVFVNGKKVRVLKRKVLPGSCVTGRDREPARAAEGTFKVKIVVLTTEGDTLKGTRKYHTCTKKRKHKKPPKL